MGVPPGARVTSSPFGAQAGAIALDTGWPVAVEHRAAGGRPRGVPGAIDLPGGGWVAVSGPTVAPPETIGVRLNAACSVGDELGSSTAIVWDPSTKRLTIARSPGSSPSLNIRVEGDVVAWSSRMGDLVRPGDAIDLGSVGAFLRAGHLTTRSTLVEGIGRVAPGETVMVEAGRLERRPTAVPSWAPESAADRTTRLAAIRGAFTEALEASVRGASHPSLTLSGGIDSTMIAVGLRRYLGLRPTAFTVRFPGESTPFDEFDHAHLTARTLGIEHEPIDLGPEFIAEHLAWMVRWFDGPFSYAVHTANLAPIVGHDRLVSGAGGDAWGLTPKERAGIVVGRLLPRRATSAVLGAGSLVGSLHVRGAKRFRGVATHAADLATALALDLESGQAADVARSLIGDEAAGGGHLRLVDYYRSRLSDVSPWVTARQLRFHLWAHVVDPDDSVGWTTTWSDAYGLRAAFPYLDPALAATLAEHVTDPDDRSEFRSLAAEHLPREASHRPKVGQSLPLASWFRTSLRDFVESVLAPEAVGADGIADPAATAALVQRHMAGTCDHHWDLLKLMTLLLWKRQVFDPAASITR